VFKDIAAFFRTLGKRFTGERLRSSIFIIVFCFILVIVPAVLALSYAYFHDDREDLSSNTVRVELYDNSGGLLSSDEVSRANIADSPLVSAFYGMCSERTAFTGTPNVDSTHNYLFTIKIDGHISQYRCYFNENVESSYIRDEKDAFYSVPETYYLGFLNSSLSERAYSWACPPVLMTGNGEEVYPRTVDWSYKRQDGRTAVSTTCKTEDSEQTYRIGGAVDLVFADLPDECAVEMLDSNMSSVYIGTLDRLPYLTVESGMLLHARISAKWNEGGGRAYHGTAEYSFAVMIEERAEFSIGTQNVRAGGFAVLSVTGVDDLSKIIFTPDTSAGASPLASVSPIFSFDGDRAVALLPIPCDAEAGRYSFSMSFGVTMQTFDIEISAREEGEEISVECSADDIAAVLSDEALNRAVAELSSVLRSPSGFALFRGDFVSPEGLGARVEYSCGDKVFGIDHNERQISCANAYLAGDQCGAAIYSMNIGTVIAAGRSNVLGNYVIVDHGLGLRMWYCHLGSIDVKEGDVLAKGDILGSYGNTAPMSGEGILVFCTVYSSFIDPSEIIGKTVYIQ